MDDLGQKFLKDRKTWDECAQTYERQIVGGHPDIAAYEEFEEDFLDRLLRFLVEHQDRRVKLMDIGCGSGRLHIRYGAKSAVTGELDESHPLVKLKVIRPELRFDGALARGISEVWGVDFSQNMIDLAKAKLHEVGLDRESGIGLSLEQGSAFDLPEESDEVLPVAISLVNSIGVTQGPVGAIKLFQSMCRAVKSAGGIAIISCYQREHLESHGLGQYESTLDVSGQPWWLIPDSYASKRYRLVPRYYKRAFSEDPEMVVDVFDKGGSMVKKGFVLRRDPERVAQTLETGNIRTHTDYESYWYGYDLIEEWIDAHWLEKSYHFRTKQLDKLRAEPAQMAIYDAGNHLEPLLDRWEVD
jgi:SAM-dependent methyltransferase